MHNLIVECGYRADLDNASPGRIVGRLINWNETGQRRKERFIPDSLQWPKGGIVLNVGHTADQLGAIMPVADSTGLAVDHPLPDTPIGRDVARKAKAGDLSGMSIEFVPIQTREVGGITEVTLGVLVGAAITDRPEYKGAAIELRHRQHRKTGLVW